MSDPYAKHRQQQSIWAVHDEPHPETVVKLPLGHRIKLFLLVFVSIPLALASGWTDLTYAIYGHVADAEVEWAHRVDPPRNKSIDVRYTFTDSESGMRTEQDNIGASWEVPIDTVRIEFIPGVHGKSRVKGQLTLFLYFMMLIGGVSVIILGLFLWTLYTERPTKTTR